MIDGASWRMDLSIVIRAALLLVLAVSLSATVNAISPVGDKLDRYVA